jgi:uncharacterized membrane protein
MSDPTVPPSPEPEPASGPAAAPPIPPQPAAQSAPTDPGAAQPASGGTGLAPNVAAGLACIFSIVGGIVFLILEKKDQFVRFYAMQSLMLGGAYMAFSFALQILSWILLHIPLVGRLIVILLGLLGMLVGLAFFAVWIVTIVKAFSGKEWEIPYIGKIAREQLARVPTTP